MKEHAWHRDQYQSEPFGDILINLGADAPLVSVTYTSANGVNSYDH